MNVSEFRKLMITVAQAWNEADAVRATNCFTEDGIYMEPPDCHFFQGHDQLFVLFATLVPGNNMEWHHIWFDEQSQVGAGEFTFASGQAHGVAVIEIENGKIKSWREYQWHGNMPWSQFTAYKNKVFHCTIENYRPN